MAHTNGWKDLLVLLYYSASANDHADEAVNFVAQYIEKHATAKILGRRRESLAETEVFIHWVIFHLVPKVAKRETQLQLSEASASTLHAEVHDQAPRLLTLCHMLLYENGLDQICLLLSCLDTYPSREAQAHLPARVRRLARGMRKRRADRATQPWHRATADQLLEDLQSLKHEARAKWGRKAGVRVGIGGGPLRS